MYHMLIQAFGFDPEMVILLKDSRASWRNILSALNYLLGNAVAGDTVCFYFAGHGGLIPASDRPDNTRFYETIIPYDEDWIFDYRLYKAAERIDSTAVNFTLIMDCCHSGGLHESDSIEKSIPRSVPFRPEVAETIQHMQTLHPFGICLPPDSPEIDFNVSNVRVSDSRLIDLDEDPDKTLVAQAKSTLIAACNYYESAGESPGYRHGYLTQAFLDIVNSGDFRISYRALLDRLRARVHELVVAEGHDPQTPQLRGQGNRMDEMFLAGWRTSA
jgi:hypothetical protein